jgi:hypothetical protein
VLLVKKVLISAVIVIGIIIYFTSAQILSDVPSNIQNEISVPGGYERIDYPSDSFSNWIQNLTLKKDIP